MLLRPTCHRLHSKTARARLRSLVELGLGKRSFEQGCCAVWTRMGTPTNFVFPVKNLQDDHIRLVPFDARAHAYPFYEGISRTRGAAFAHFSSGPYASADDFNERFVKQRSYADKRMCTYAILTSPEDEGGVGDLVGMVSLTNADAEDRRADIGLLHVVPKAQGLGIGTTACRMLLRHGMDSHEHGGLGLARMEWRASTANEASIGLARRLGFREVGVIRYERLLRDGVARGKIGNGRPPPPGTTDGDLWRDVVVYEMTWDEWQQAHRH
ncbi:hypothetical protein JDV02_004044 [Purpureocillium takamizusanense]|uniref:N-acetyltransferase domain-containing protein n=1 Tax=Purpureocillium takamizusanense TaxID=2060973 RepID=A0A9Q8QCX7_9HYPO|nr:uncharacterized protein JDV02_004044 [Purpureocillium takamizusanense]UNI17723.1 hypothetical protein JDV02_004044 [Purpureocillium takamizusanense]